MALRGAFIKAAASFGVYAIGQADTAGLREKPRPTDRHNSCSTLTTLIYQSAARQSRQTDRQREQQIVTNSPLQRCFVWVLHSCGAFNIRLSQILQRKKKKTKRINDANAKTVLLTAT